MKYEKLLCATGTTFAVAVMAITATALIFTMAGCGGSANGGGGGGTNSSIAEGNWSIVGTSTAMPGQVYSIGGHITQSGSTLSGTMHVLGPCENSQARDPGVFVALTGSVNGTQFAFTLGPTIAGSVIQGTLTGTGSSLSSLTGTFTVSGGCATSDNGTAAATLMPSTSGTWAGTGSTTAGDPNVTVSITFTQQSTPDASGTYDLTGTLNYTNSSCTASGIPLFGNVYGSNVFLDVDESAINPVVFFFSGSLDEPATATSFTGTYQTFNGGTIAACAGDSGSIKFAKQ